MAYVVPQHLLFTKKWGHQGGIGMRGEGAHTKNHQKIIWN